MRQKRSRLWQIWLPADLENKGTATMGERQKFLCGNAVSKGIAIAKAYRYEPLDETLNGNDRPYITEKTMTTKQKLLRFFGFFNEFQIQTEI